MGPITHLYQITLTESQIKELEELCMGTWFADTYRSVVDIPEVLSMMMDDLITTIRELKRECGWSDENGFSKRIAAQYIRKFYRDIDHMEEFIKYLDECDELVDTASSIVYLQDEMRRIQAYLESISTGTRFYSSSYQKKVYWYDYVDGEGTPIFTAWDDYKKSTENIIVESREEAKDWSGGLHKAWMEFYDSERAEKIRLKLTREQFAERSPWMHCFDHIKSIYYHPEVEENEEIAAQYKSCTKPL